MAMGVLKFTFFCIHNLAWPSIALGYPLYASIRAVNSDSKYHMRKLVMYWILFSLLSLFEFAFAKIIHWIPYWSSVRIAVMYWLVIPEFEGACLLTPALLVKLKEVVDLFHKLKEERLSKRESISDAVEKYVEENGFEALEKLIESEKLNESLKCIDFQRDAKIMEEEGVNAAVTSNLVLHEQAVSSSQVLTRTCSVANAEEMARPEASMENGRSRTPPLEKCQQEWSSGSCNFNTMSVPMLNTHLRWTNHKSKLESMKATLLDDEDTGLSPLQQVQSFPATSKFNHGNVGGKLIEESGSELEKLIEFVNTSAEITPDPLEKPQQEWSCDLCKVKVSSEKTLITHLSGKKHKSAYESLKKNRIKIKGGVRWCMICDAKLLNDGNASSHFKGKRHALNIEKMEKLEAMIC